MHGAGMVKDKCVFMPFDCITCLIVQFSFEFFHFWTTDFVFVGMD